MIVQYCQIGSAHEEQLERSKLILRDCMGKHVPRMAIAWYIALDYHWQTLVQEGYLVVVISDLSDAVSKVIQNFRRCWYGFLGLSRIAMNEYIANLAIFLPAVNDSAVVKV